MCSETVVIRAEKIAGSVYGSAIGDALGSAFEFIDASTIDRILGEPFAWNYQSALPGSLLHPRCGGLPTADTAMALAVASAIGSGEVLTSDCFAHQFLRDLSRGTGRFSDMFWTGLPDKETTKALLRLNGGCDPAICGEVADGGHGAVMRAYPIGFLTDREQVLRVAAIQARVTQGSSGSGCCGSSGSCSGIRCISG